MENNKRSYPWPSNFSIGMNFVSVLMCLAAEAAMEYTAGAYTIALAIGIYSSE